MQVYKNQNELDKYLDELIEKVEDELSVIFANRAKEMKDRMARMMEAHKRDKRISRTDLYNTKRYKEEMEFIKENIHKDYQQIYNEINRLMKTTYVDNLLMSGYLYAFESQKQMTYQIPSAETIRQAILNPIAELTLSALMNEHRNEIVKRIRRSIAEGIQAGESYADIAIRIQDVTDFSTYKAQRVARTETGRVQTISRMKSADIASKYANLKKVWNATLDQDVRSSHRVLDDQEADENGYFHYKGHKAVGPHLFTGPKSASLNINCRCNIMYTVNGNRPELRRARNYEDAIYQQKLADRIDEYMKYGYTEKQATKKAKKEVKPPSLVIPYNDYQSWYKSLPKEALK